MSCNRYNDRLTTSTTNKSNQTTNQKWHSVNQSKIYPVIVNPAALRYGTGGAAIGGGVDDGAIVFGSTNEQVLKMELTIS